MWSFIILYFSSNIVRIIEPLKIKGAGHLACMGAMKNAYNIFVGKPEGKRPLGRPRHRYHCNDRFGFLLFINLLLE
jgi:hypothetical protein